MGPRMPACMRKRMQVRRNMAWGYLSWRQYIGLLPGQPEYVRRRGEDSSESLLRALLRSQRCPDAKPASVSWRQAARPPCSTNPISAPTRTDKCLELGPNGAARILRTVDVQVVVLRATFD